MNKKETEEHANSTAFKELFCLRFNLSKTSNDDTISALRPGLKKGKDFRGLVWKRASKMTFFGLK